MTIDDRIFHRSGPPCATTGGLWASGPCKSNAFNEFSKTQGIFVSHHDRPTDECHNPCALGVTTLNPDSGDSIDDDVKEGWALACEGRVSDPLEGSLTRSQQFEAISSS